MSHTSNLGGGSFIYTVMVLGYFFLYINSTTVFQNKLQFSVKRLQAKR